MKNNNLAIIKPNGQVFLTKDQANSKNPCKANIKQLINFILSLKYKLG